MTIKIKYLFNKVRHSRYCLTTAVAYVRPRLVDYSESYNDSWYYTREQVMTKDVAAAITEATAVCRSNQFRRQVHSSRQ